MQVLPFGALGVEELAAWHALRAANTALDSPYFHPGFAAAVAACGPAVSVVVRRDTSGAVDLLMPVHRDGRLVRPVGWPAADFQGPIAAPGTAFDPRAVLTGRVRGMAFDHLLDPAPGFGPWIESSRPSPYLDVTGGMPGYLDRAARSGRENMAQARRRAHKAERELGAYRFVVDSRDPALLDEVIRLKRAQYAATGARDYFATPARRALPHRLLAERDPAFGGLLSAVYAGDRLLAAHFGLRSAHVLHWWFPVYDPAFRALAPGWMLLRELVAAAPDLGVRRIDLGRGEDEYKRRAKTGEVEVAQGFVHRSAPARELHRARLAAMHAVRTSPLAPALRAARHRARTLAPKRGLAR